MQMFAVPPAGRLRARYLLVQFLTHYGTEEVCVINQLRVSGVSVSWGGVNQLRVSG